MTTEVNLYEFLNDLNGTTPVGGLENDDTYFYGCTSGDNSEDAPHGTIFRFNYITNTFETLYTLSFEESSGIVCPLLLNDGVLYGSTLPSGESGGKIFSINVDGTNFQILHIFNGTDGITSGGRLVTDGIFLYGNSPNSRGGNLGTLFSIRIIDGVLVNVFTFSDSVLNGDTPLGGLVLTGFPGVLYGTTVAGGENNLGCIYSIDINEGFFGMQIILYSFQPNESFQPLTRLTTDGIYLYGTSILGGVNNLGTIFSLKLSDNTYNLLHSFTESPGPQTALLITDDTLYGTTVNGTNFLEPTNESTFYSIKKDGTNFTILYTFTGNDAQDPSGNTILIGNKFYGTSQYGGVNNLGTIYSITFTPSCFDSSTYITCLVNGEEKEVLISELNSSSLVKTYKHGYRKIDQIKSSSLVNSDHWYGSMYLLPNKSFKEQTRDLILTGGHSICVDTLSEKESTYQHKYWIKPKIIDDKYLLLASVCDKFVQIKNKNVYKYYNFSLFSENKNQRFGIYANGVLCETPSSNQMNKTNFH